MKKNVVALPRVKLYSFAKTGQQRSVKQKAQAAKLGRTTMAYAKAVKAVLSQPSESWWIGLDRMALEQRAQQEVTRMSASKFYQSFGVD